VELPLVASRRLGLGTAGYGFLLGAVGRGAVAALLLAQLRSRLSPSWFFVGATLVYAGVLAVTGLVANVAIVTLCLVLAGVAWVAILSSLNASMQLILPAWVRGRGLTVERCELPSVPGRVVLQRPGVRLAARPTTGASSWQLYRDGEQPDCFLELFVGPLGGAPATARRAAHRRRP
jgi:hypothetical protein